MSHEFRVVMGVVALLAARGASLAQPAPPPEFYKSRLADVDAAVKQVKKGTARVLATSAGKRDIHLVTYGAAADLNSRANYNSACGGVDPASYARKNGQQSPVVFLLGPVHGGELEGIVGLVNLLAVAETGKDLRGKEWKELAGNLARCRVLIVPSGNPDGRARCKYDSWVGETLATYEPIEMGVQPDGKSYKWPGVKRVHPMRPGDYKSLGTYFNDDGVNLMHDEWFDPMASETRAFLKLARAEAPDFIVSLHSHASAPSVEPTAYVPFTVKQTIKEFADGLYKRYAAAGLPARKAGPEPKEDGKTFPPPSFNLCSALHHASGATSFVYECCLGLHTDPYPRAAHEQILDLQMLLYDELFRYAVEHHVKWTK
jgi:hypothetical protein